MAEALASVKRELGRDAVIVHTRSVKVGGVMGLGAQTMIEIAAQPADAAHIARSPRQNAFTPMAFPKLDADANHVVTPGAPVPTARGGDRSPQPTRASGAQPVNSPGGTQARAGTRPQSVPADEFAAAPPISLTAQAPGFQGNRSLVTPVRLTPVDAGARAALESEVASIKRMVAQLVQASRSANPAGASILAFGGMPDELLALYATLLERGITPDIADLLIARVRDEAGPHASDVRKIAGDVLATIVAHDPGLGTGRREVVALVGPTGVGKTTTIAKLAAHLKLAQGRRVGLITADTYRIAAVEQLRTYAGIIGLPLRVVLGPDEVEGAVESLKDCDCILLDTAGRSHHDSRRVEDTRLILQAARASAVHLVISASSSEAVQRRVLDGFLPLDYGHIIFSKLDEAEHPGVMLNSAIRAGKPLSFFSTGQEVPEDLVLAEPATFSRLVLDGVLPASSHHAPPSPGSEAA